MKAVSVYQYLSYLDWMNIAVEQNQSHRGYHKAMSEAAGCQPSFLSQVFRSKTHLTPDQAAGLCEFWAFNGDETEYFISLVHFERSGSKTYRKILKQKLDSLRHANAEVSKRVEHHGTLELEHKARYYSDWHWAIIHIMTSVPKFQDPLRIAAALGLDAEHVIKILKDLRTMNLVQQNGSKWTIGDNLLHLDRSSPFNVINQRNFRQFAQNSLSRDRPDDLHYSAIYGLSTKAYQEIREMLLSLITSANRAVIASKEEQAACMTLDLISL